MNNLGLPVALQAGARLGAYEILAALGAGGMGEVYRAHDSKLGRDVALKILPEAFATDPERLARFEREARALAALNHPNIGAIYGIEEQSGATALVLEFVEGETLADVSVSGGLIPSTEALRDRPSDCRRARRCARDRASSTAISSRRTSRFDLMAASRCWTSGSRRRCSRRPRCRPM